MADTTPVTPPAKSATRKEPVTAEVFVPTPSFTSGAFDDADARQAFIDKYGADIDADTVEQVGKQHDIGRGILYVFRAAAK